MKGRFRFPAIGLRVGRLVVLEEPQGPWEPNGPLVACRCDCGNISKKRTSLLLRALTKSCGSRGPDRHDWKGGRLITGGYIRVYAPNHHRASKGYAMEHILVMEQKIGRMLLPGETIHHINGVRGDNRPENLELWDQNHCAGQRHVERMAFCVQEIVSKASDEEMAIILRALQKRVRERSNRPPVVDAQLFLTPDA